MAIPKLIIDRKNYSSWSLRSWLILKKLGIEFEEIRIPLFTEGYKERLLQYSPTGKVLVYIEEDLVIWETSAIARLFSRTISINTLERVCQVNIFSLEDVK